MFLRSCFLLFFLGYSNGANILFPFPMCIRSHQAVVGPILMKLAERGHKITVLTENIFWNHTNIETVLMEPSIQKVLGYHLSYDCIFSGAASVMIKVHNIGNDLIENMAKSEKFQNFIKLPRHFDAILSFSGAAQEALTALAHRYGAVSIDIMPHGNCMSLYYYLGEPVNPSYWSDVKLSYSDKMSFFERLDNTLVVYFTILYTCFFNIRKQQHMADKYMTYPGWENRPPLIELMSNKSLVLVNTHFSLGYPYPFSPRIKDIAGINTGKHHPLTEEYKAFVEGSKKPLVMVCWGSLINENLDAYHEFMDSMLAAFRKIKRRIIWKTGYTNFKQPVPENVMISKWIPQVDLLASGKIGVFVTHGGFSSMVETIYYGVPVVATPFILDQRKNAIKYVDLGMGIMLNPENLTEESLIWALNEILENPTYKNAAKKSSLKLNDRLYSPLDEAVFWMEYVIKHGNILTPASQHMSAFVLLQLDIICFILVVSGLIYFIASRLLKWYMMEEANNVARKEKLT